MRAITPGGLRENVVSVPPVAWKADGELDFDQNRKLVRHIEDGGVSHLLYGGNANLYHFTGKQLASLLDFLRETVAATSCVIPSIGPDFGKMMDEVDILKASGFNSAMLLPMAFPAQPEGVAIAVRRVAERLGNPVILYVKKDGYLTAETISSLVNDGAVSFVKYAVERENPADDNYLKEIIAGIGADLVGSGMGETPIHVHFPQYKVGTYTSGGVCIAPRAASALHKAFKSGDQATADELLPPFIDFEKVRAQYNGISVIHDAIGLSGIANMGPMLPMLANVSQKNIAAVQSVVDGLVTLESRFT